MNTSLKISQIATDAGTQIRAAIDEAVVTAYAEAMLDAANKFPPVVVFDDGNRMILADGFHRVMASVRNEFLDILADVRKGTKSDALKYALSANAVHGLRRSNADKRRSVELALAEWPKLSSHEIAKVCAVSHTFVDSERQLATVASSPRVGGDGKTRKLPAKKAAPVAAEQSHPDGGGSVHNATSQPPTEKATPSVSLVPEVRPPRDAEFLKALGRKGKPVYSIAVFNEEAIGLARIAIAEFDFETLVKAKTGMNVAIAEIETKLAAFRKAERAAKKAAK